MPDSVDSYYQQIGRAGRDGEAATALTFYRPEDLSLATFFTTHAPDEALISRVFRILRKSSPRRLGQLRDDLGVRGRRLSNAVNLLERCGAVTAGRRGFSAADLPVREVGDRAREVAASGERMDRSRVEMMRGYAETRGCRRRFLLGYFGEVVEGPCGNCDNCRAGVPDEFADPAAGASSLTANNRVHHAEWGAGTVMGGEGDRVTVLFDSVGYRTLSLEAIAKADLLRTDDGKPAPRGRGFLPPSSLR
ncbi:RecQ family zinc-binding domain-containing protein [Rhodococcus sp. Z13]|uniref:RecQ family zinc-binding domain-containing protein n=1 Tax=Rhodococcus sacchari TaxID=2962047 RepID=A0ACD4DL03_9NOCA|nr:RecQ family zinc-binding domain-containing protein [Rhodococcus sp. Z13]UYP20717.1 RecQ family zinc-binding domain-containing protein [Rhodococcus sp. Z13]